MAKGRSDDWKAQSADGGAHKTTGGGLYLHVASSGARSWIVRYWVEHREPDTGEPVRDPKTGKVRGRSREMGLGSCSIISLEQARELAAEYRRLRRDCTDPIEARRAKKGQTALEAAKSMSFSKCAAEYFKSHSAGWRSAKHAHQWQASLATYAEPIIGDLPVQAVDTALMCKVWSRSWGDRRAGSDKMHNRGR